ncbi:AMP-binding protein [soil metagenome]
MTDAFTATDPSGYTAAFDDRVAAVVADAARRVPAFARRLADAGLSAGAVTGSAALEGLPVLTKDDVLAAQHADPPFGGLLAGDVRPRRVFQSPGPIYEAELDAVDHWRWAPALEAAGFGPDDVVLNAFGHHLSPAGAMFEQACLVLGCTVVPAGVGNADAQVRACADLGVTAYVGVPSYLNKLLELDPSLALQRAFVSAEPLPPSLRDRLLERVAVVRQGYGTAEAGHLGHECSAMDGWHVAEDALVQVCDPATGAPLTDGREGQVVVTGLSTAAPLVRFGTGDLSAWHDQPCPCGARTPRLRGWLGRVGDGVKVRGMFLHPRQVSDAMGALSDVTAHRFTVDRIDHRDVLACAVVLRPGAAADEVVPTVRQRIRETLRFDVTVEVADSLSDGPVIEDRRRWD